MKIEAQTLVFDTGPLWELVLYRAVHTFGFVRLVADLTYLQNDTSYERFSQFISRFRNRLTTPQVVAEISFRVVRTEKQGQHKIWSVVRDEFAGLDEKMVKLLEMPFDSVVKLGAVDVSLLKLGSTFDSGVPLVLSIDRSLIAECTRCGVAALHLWEVIAEENE